MKILLIDDNETDAELLLHSLKGRDIEFVFCKNLETALETFRSDRFDLIVSDYNMPGTSGREIFHKIREIDTDVPFIIASGSLGEELAVDLLREGVTDYVLKNNPKKLPLAIDRALTEFNNKKDIENTLEQLNFSLQSKSSLIDNIPGVVYRYSAIGDPQIEFLSEACERITSYTVQELENKTLDAIIHKDDLARVKEVINDATTRHRGFEIEYRIIDKENKIRHIWDKGTAIYNFRGEPLAIEGLMMDVTNERKREKILKIINETVNISAGKKYFTDLTQFLSESLDFSYVEIAYYDPSNHTVQTTSRRLNGVELENETFEITGTPLECVIKKGLCSHVKDVQSVYPNVHKLKNLNAESYFGISVRNYKQEVTGLIVLIDSKPITDSFEIETALSIVASRVGNELDRIVIENKLIISEEKHRSVVESQTEMIVRWDPAGTILFANGSFQKYHKKNLSDLQLISYYSLISNKTRLETKIGKLTKENPQNVDIHRTKDRNGNYVWQEWTDCAFFDHTGKIVEIQSIGRDITEQKMAELRLRENEAFKHSILSALSASIAVIDADGTILTTNETWKSFGLENSALINHIDVGVNYLSVCQKAAQEGDELADAAFEGIKKVIGKKINLFEQEYPCHSKKEQRWFLMRVTPFDGSKGGAVITHFEITEKKNQTEELKISYLEILNAERINHAMISGDSIQQISYLLLECIEDSTGIDRGRIYLYNKEDNKLVLFANKTKGELKAKVKQKTGVELDAFVPTLHPNSIFTNIIAQKKPVLTSDPKEIITFIEAHTDDPELKKLALWAQENVVVKSFGAFPILANNEVIGLMTIAGSQPLDQKRRETLIRFSQHASTVMAKKKNEESLVESEEKFKAIANFTANWETWFNPEGKPIWINPEAQKMIGYSPEELLAFPNFIETIVYRDDLEKVTETFMNALVNKTTGDNFEFRCNHKNGSTPWFSLSWNQVYDTQGKWLGVRSSGTDITQKKIQEKILEAQRKTLIEINTLNTRIIETSDQVFYVCPVNPDKFSITKVSYISPQVEELFAVSKNDILTDINLWLKQVHKDDSKLLSDRILELIKQKKPIEIVYRIYNSKVKKYLWVEDYVCPMLDNKGRIYELYGSIKNISDKIVALRTLQKEKKQSAVYQSQLLSSQLNPHFIYNTLNSFQYYILSGEVEESLNNISAFSALMRNVLENSIKKFISFQEEIDFIHKYIEISKKRLQQPLDCSIKIPADFDLVNQYIPPMLMQPYIENAFVHGFSASDKPCVLSIEISLNKDVITCKIEDNGIGRKEAKDTKVQRAGKKRSLGMGINKSRIQLLNETTDNEFRVKVKDLIDKNGASLGTAVTIKYNQITEEAEE